MHLPHAVPTLSALCFKNMPDTAHGLAPFMFEVVGMGIFIIPALFYRLLGLALLLSGSKGLHPEGKDFTRFLIG
jgi:hypothetical protein